MAAIKRSRKIKFPEPDFLPAPEKWAKKWKEEHVRTVFFLSLMGCNDAQMAQVFGIDQSVLDYWKRKKPEFMDSMKRGKMEADAKVVHSLYLSAIGYSHPAEVIIPGKFREYDKEGKLTNEYTKAIRVNTTKSYPPNVTAIIKWLSARQPDVWGNKLKVEHKVDHTHKVDLSKFSQEELLLMKRLGVQPDEDNNPMIEDIESEEI